MLRDLRKQFVIGFVGGSDFRKIQEQLGVTGNNGAVILTICILVRPNQCD